MIDDNNVQEAMQKAEWLKDIQSSVIDELDYTYKAYREKPSHVDYDEVPFQRIIHFQLKIIFDAFEEICKRLKIISTNKNGIQK
jgi:hypothetical protein